MSTYPTATTDRGASVAYDPTVIADHRDEIDAALRTAEEFLLRDLIEARKVAARYAKGPRTVATEGYAAKPAQVELALAQTRLAIEAMADGHPLFALYAARGANTAYCPSGMLALPAALGAAQQAIWTAWRLALAAAR
jgi:hypothetical protein